MSLFRCEACGCCENTACCNYAWRRANKQPPLCSACDPDIDMWHGRFPQRSAAEYRLGSDGFLYSQAEIDSGSLKWRMENQGFRIVDNA